MASRWETIAGLRGDESRFNLSGPQQGAILCGVEDVQMAEKVAIEALCTLKEEGSRGMNVRMWEVPLHQFRWRFVACKQLLEKVSYTPAPSVAALFSHKLLE
ncbi:MAG: hypothetical protein N2595_08915 [bacterium]|nr:hypothetical protein [bacterium]